MRQGEACRAVMRGGKRFRMVQIDKSAPKGLTPAQTVKIEPLFNSAFARIFGREESKPLTRGLVNAVLRRIGLEPIREIERIDAEHTATEGSVNCKSPRMDVRIVAAGRFIDVEAQGYPEDVGNRSMLYAAQLLCEGMPRGAGYKDLPQAIVITLLDAPALFPESEEFVHTCGMVWDPEGQALRGPDRVLFVVVELEKVRRRYNHLDDEVLSDELLSWAYLLTNGYRDDAEVQKMMDEVPDIEYFAELYGRAVDDPKVKRAFEDAVSAEREYQSRQDYYARLEREAIERGIQQGIEQGIQQGIQQGIEQERSSVADKLRKLGVDEAIITQAISAS